MAALARLHAISTTVTVTQNWPARGRRMTGVVMVTLSARRRRRDGGTLARHHCVTT